MTRIKFVQFAEAVRIFPREGSEVASARISTHLTSQEHDIALVDFTHFEVSEKNGGSILSIIPFNRAVCCTPMTEETLTDLDALETDSSDEAETTLAVKARVKSKLNARSGN